MIKPLILQRRLTEVGRIRIGEVVPTRSGKTRPSKIDVFRVTSPDRSILEQIAKLYGGTVEPWTPQGGGAAQYEVKTQASSLPVVVPPQSVTQHMEAWSGGGATRRCDGERDLISGNDCICAANDNMICKPTTRLSVMLRDVESVGVFRLESKGWNAAAELPGMAELLERVGGYVQARLYLKPVRQVTNGETRDFMVPALAVDGVTPAQLLAGTASNGYATPELARESAPAIESAPDPDIVEAQRLADAAQDAKSADEIRDIWRSTSSNRVLDSDVSVPLGDNGQRKTLSLRDLLTVVLKGFVDREQNQPAPLAPVPDAAPDQSTTELWMAAMAAAPDGWTTDQLVADFSELHGGQVPSEVSAEVLTKYVANLKTRGPAAIQGAPF